MSRAHLDPHPGEAHKILVQRLRRGRVAGSGEADDLVARGNQYLAHGQERIQMTYGGNRGNKDFN